jgi:glycosyltransferase involved in cell wall biosynthesis
MDYIVRKEYQYKVLLLATVARPFIVACLPAYNEEANIAKVIVDTLPHVDQVIVCDDGSDDSTARIAEKMGAVVISHDRNYGYGAAIASLFEKAREMKADIMVTLDADGQHIPSEIAGVIQPIIDGHAEIVIGSRFLDKPEQSTNDPREKRGEDEASSYRKFGIGTITTISNFVSKSKLTDSQSGFRAYHRRAINEIQVTEQGMGASTEILLKARLAELKIIEVPITVKYGKDTSTQNSVYHGIDVVISTLKFVSIDHPLRFYGLPGLVSLLLAAFFIAWAIQIYTEEGRLVTNIALLGMSLLIVGIMLLTTSVILYVIINVVREGPRRLRQ